MSNRFSSVAAAKRHVALYARVSTPDQAKQDRQSIPDQLSACRKAAHEEGYGALEIIEYVDAGITGALGEHDRPEYTRLLASMRAGQVAVVYFAAMDRFTRDAADGAQALKLFEQTNTKMRSLREPHASDWLIGLLTLGLAQAEHRQIRERTFPKRMAKLAQGFWVVGKPPYGYRLDHSTKTLRQCPNEAPILKRIFDLALAGLGRTQIARVLNNQGAPAPEAQISLADGSTKRFRVGHVIDQEGLGEFLKKRNLEYVPKTGAGRPWPEWRSSTIAKILINSVAYGSHNSIALKIYPSPIITEKVFNDVQKGISKRYLGGGAEHTANWLLTGFLRCESCGRKYIHHESRNYHRYCCGSRRAGQGCPNPNLSMKVADAKVIAELQRFLSEAFPAHEQLKTHIEATANQRLSELRIATESLNVEFAQAAANRDTLERMWQSGIRNGLPEDAMRLTASELALATSNVSRLDSERSDLGLQIAEIEAGLVARGAEVSDVVAGIMQAVNLVSNEGEITTDLRAVLDAVVKQVLVTKGGDVVVDFQQKESAITVLLKSLARNELRFQRDMKFALHG